MRPGRKTLPTPILAMRNSRKLGKRLENTTGLEGSGTPTMPADLTPRAAEIWNIVVPELQRLGILDAVDGWQLKRYCVMFDQWEQAVEFLRVNGSVCAVYDKESYDEIAKDEHGNTVTTFKGTPIKVKRQRTTDTVCYWQQVPHVAIARNLATELRQIESSFAMTPSDRAALDVTRLHASSEKEQSPLSALMAKRQERSETG